WPPPCAGGRRRPPWRRAWRWPPPPRARGAGCGKSRRGRWRRWGGPPGLPPLRHPGRPRPRPRPLRPGPLRPPRSPAAPRAQRAPQAPPAWTPARDRPDSSRLREAHAEVAIPSGVRHGRHGEALDLGQRRPVLQVAHVVLDRLLAPLHSNLHVPGVKVDRVTGEVAVLRPPLSEAPVADALDTSFDDDLGRSAPARQPGSALLQGPPARGPAPRGRREMVGATGFEPATSCSRSRRATKLRYAPIPSARAPHRGVVRANPSCWSVL